MVELYNDGKLSAELVHKYELISFVLFLWVKEYNNNELLHVKDNHSDKEKNANLCVIMY